MKVAIVGSRNYPHLWEVEDFVRALARKYPEAVVISGGASGVDLQAEETARAMMLHVRSYRPKRRGRGYEILLVETGRFVTTVRDEENKTLRFKSFKDAAFYRNGLIINDAAAGAGGQVVAFHYQDSSGTRDSIGKARAISVPLHIYHPRELSA